jgi:Co/Zn/Cd efflux system component
MNSPNTQSTWQREELLHLLTLSATLAGLCITGVTLFRTIGRSSLPETVADNTLAISAVLFLVCTYTIFFALRTKRNGLAALLEKIADGLFLLALTGMVASGFIMVYTVW